MLFAVGAYATTYTSLTIAQNATVQIGSPSENLFLAMQGDGNLVLYQNGTALWDSNTAGQSCGANQCRAVFQTDGNFVVYNGSTALWNSGTAGNAGAQLVLTDQLPHMEIVGTNQSILWANAYIFSAGNFRLAQGASAILGPAFLVMQGDGNLVLYQGGTALWNSGTPGQNCGTNQCFAVFQGDGNFIVYNGSTPIWSSQTNGNLAAQLLLSSQPPYVQVLGTLTAHYPAKDYIYLNGQIVAVENP
jgi:hypothetical protein